MNILYISSVCAQSRFDRLVAQGHINGQFQNQKFHHLLLLGLIEIKNVSISVVSFYPVNRTKGLDCTYEEEVEGRVKYFYPEYINKPILHHITKFIGTYKFLKRHRQSESVIVCNIMNFDECLAALVYRLFNKIKICAITADIPGVTSGAGNSVGALWKRIMNRMVYPFYKKMSKHYDAYMFLSEAMSNVVNPANRPYVVVEGFADLSMKMVDNTIANKNPKKTLMYAGGLHREYGLPLLVDAFRNIKDSNIELHLYGKGNYEKELQKIAEEDVRLKYFGTRPNSEIVSLQLKAHVLVNPRPTKAEFVKYSFPSKIIEYMASGTPLLTTCIPSMPKDYYPHVYTIDEETVEGFYNSFAKVLSFSDEQLCEKGKSAKAFILREKNYKVQTEKLYQLLCSIIYC